MHLPFADHASKNNTDFSSGHRARHGKKHLASSLHMRLIGTRSFKGLSSIEMSKVPFNEVANRTQEDAPLPAVRHVHLPSTHSH